MENWFKKVEFDVGKKYDSQRKANLEKVHHKSHT